MSDLTNSESRPCTVTSGMPRKIIFIIGLPGPANIWLADACRLLLGARAPGLQPTWCGLAKNLPGGKFPAGDCVVRTSEPDDPLLAATDHVLYAARDLRDAVVACHRALGSPPDLALAKRIVDFAETCERSASSITTYESILADPIASLRQLAEHLDLAVDAPETLVGQLRKSLAAATAAAGADATPARAFLVALPLGVIEQIEARFGGWLRERGYSCTTCSDAWAGVTDRAQGRERLWDDFCQMAGECSNVSRPTGSGPTGMCRRLERLEKFFARFGALRFQLAAADLLLALGGRNQTVECAKAQLLARQRRFAEAATLARQALELGPEAHVSVLFQRYEASRMSVGKAADLPRFDPPSVLRRKTSAQPLPFVSAHAEADSDTIRQLADKVRGRTVGFLLHGSSVGAFAAHAAELTACDAVWAGLNHFTLLEDRFLRPCGREFSLVFCCADGEVERRLPALESFLERSGPRLLITRPDHFERFSKQLAPHRSSIGLEMLPPVWPYPNSLTLFLRLLVQAGPRRIVLFGCDGYLGDDDVSLPSYLGAEQFIQEKRYSGVLLDTLLSNAHLPRVLAQWRARIGPEFPEIVNCSPGTVIQGFPTIDYAQAGAALAGERLRTVRPGVVPDIPVLVASSPYDPQPDLTRCLNAGRQGRLGEAREHALRALRLEPASLTPFAQRVLQTEPGAIAAGYQFMLLSGGTHPGPEQIRAEDFSREMRETREAIGNFERSWDTWE